LSRSKGSCWRRCGDLPKPPTNCHSIGAGCARERCEAPPPYSKDGLGMARFCKTGWFPVVGRHPHDDPQPVPGRWRQRVAALRIMSLGLIQQHCPPPRREGVLRRFTSAALYIVMHAYRKLWRRRIEARAGEQREHWLRSAALPRLFSSAARPRSMTTRAPKLRGIPSSVLPSDTVPAKHSERRTKHVLSLSIHLYMH
jgi:hypothetical protein